MRREIERRLRQADLAAFLAQQAVEKYLKGAWVVTKKEPAPHTHALRLHPATKDAVRVS